MAWSASGIFAQTLADGLKGTITLNLDLETHKIALYNNSVTPDYNATAANTAYGAGTWVGNEVTGTNWAAGGVALTSTTVTIVAGGIVMWDAADVSVASTTITGAYGGLIYADALTTPVADQGIAGIYFGGSAYSTVNGTFAITWDANGIWRTDNA